MMVGYIGVVRQWIIHNHLTAICLRKFITTGSGVDEHGQSHMRPCKMWRKSQTIHQKIH